MSWRTRGLSQYRGELQKLQRRCKYELEQRVRLPSALNIIINFKEDFTRMAGHMNIMPFIILNMGGEMIFILEHRLRA